MKQILTKISFWNIINEFQGHFCSICLFHHRSDTNSPYIGQFSMYVFFSIVWLTCELITHIIHASEPFLGIFIYQYVSTIKTGTITFLNKRPTEVSLNKNVNVALQCIKKRISIKQINLYNTCFYMYCMFASFVKSSKENGTDTYNKFLVLMDYRASVHAKMPNHLVLGRKNCNAYGGSST